MFGLRPLPVRKATKHVIVDGAYWPIDKEYAELGVREGWLVMYRLVEQRNGEAHYYYRYPNSHNTE